MQINYSIIILTGVFMPQFHVSYEYFVDRATANAILSVFRITLLY